MKQLFKSFPWPIMAFLTLLVATSCGNKQSRLEIYKTSDQPCGITPELRKMQKKYADLFSIDNGLFIVSSKSTMVDETGRDYHPMGCIDRQGKIVIPIQYEGLVGGDSIFIVSKRTNNGVRYGLLDIEGNDIVPIEFEELFSPDFSHNYVKVKKDGLYGVIDKKEGKIHIPIQYDDLQRFYVDAAYKEYNEEELPDVFIAKRHNRQEVINLSPEKMKQKPSTPYDVVLVGEYGNQSFMDYQGRIIAGPFKNVRVSGDRRVTLFPEGLAAVVKNNKVGFIDMQGIVKIPFVFDYTEYKFNYYSSHFAIFSDGWAAMMKGNKWGYIDKNGKVAIPFIYDRAGCFHQNVALVGKGERLGLIDKSNTVILPFEFDNGVYTGSVFAMCQNGKWGVYSPTGECITPCQYDVLINFFRGYATVEKNGKKGLIDEQGHLLIPCQYDACLYEMKTGHVFVQLNGKQGFVDLQNQVVVPVEFDLANPCYDNTMYCVKKNGRYGLFDICGNCTLD